MCPALADSACHSQLSSGDNPIAADKSSGYSDRLQSGESGRDIPKEAAWFVTSHACQGERHGSEPDPQAGAEVPQTLPSADLNGAPPPAMPKPSRASIGLPDIRAAAVRTPPPICCNGLG